MSLCDQNELAIWEGQAFTEDWIPQDCINWVLLDSHHRVPVRQVTLSNHCITQISNIY